MVMRENPDRIKNLCYDKSKKQHIMVQIVFFLTIFNALRELLPFAPFKKLKKHPWKSVAFSKSITPLWVFFAFFKLFKLYQIAQSVSYHLCKGFGITCLLALNKRYNGVKLVASSHWVVVLVCFRSALNSTDNFWLYDSCFGANTVFVDIQIYLYFFRSRGVHYNEYINVCHTKY